MNKTTRRRPAFKLRVLSAVALATFLFIFGFIFGLRTFASFSPVLHASSESCDTADDIEVPYRYISVGWIDWAVVQLQELLETTEPDAETLALLGMAQESLGDYAAALKAYGQIEALFPDDREWVGRAKALAGLVHLRLDRIDEARELLADANRLVPDQALVLYGLGTIAERDGDLKGALDWFERSAEVSPQWPDPAVRAAAVYNELGDPVRSVTLLRPYEARASRNPHFYYQLALAYAELVRLSDRNSIDESDLKALESVGVAGDDVTSTLRALARHAADRVRQLDPDHPGLDGLAKMLDELQ